MHDLATQLFKWTLIEIMKFIPTVSEQSPLQVTAIEFKQVHVPVCKRLSISLIITQTARVSSAGFLSHICINTQLQAFRVDLKEGKHKMFKPAGGSVCTA